MNGWEVPLFLLHPMAVHFPIALLVLGLALGLVGQFNGAPDWVHRALPWVLGLGIAALWATLGLGLVAEHLAPHVPPAWRTMAQHQRDAWATAWTFSALGVAWVWARGRPRARPWLLAGWAVGLGLLVLTAHLGAQLVYVYGLGSLQP